MSAISRGWTAIWNSELRLTLSFLKFLLAGTFYHRRRKETGTAILQLPPQPCVLLHRSTGFLPSFSSQMARILQACVWAWFSLCNPKPCQIQLSCYHQRQFWNQIQDGIWCGLIQHLPPHHHQIPVLGAVVFLWWKTWPTICVFWSKQLCMNSLVQIVTVSFMMVADPQAGKELARFLITWLYVSRLIYAEVIFPRSAS